MSLNFVKIVELLLIEQKLNKHYLHIRVYLDQELELFWEIDSSTASSLLSICEFDGVHKYRLSLRTKADAGTNNYTSYVTKTYLNSSNRLNFSCSEQFKEQLELIKQCTSQSRLLQLSFLRKDLPSIVEDETEDTNLDQPASTVANEQSKANLAVSESGQPTNENSVSNQKVEQNKNADNIENGIIQNEVLEEAKAMESLLKTKPPQRGKNKTGILIAIASISILVVVLVGFFILQPNDEPVTEQKEEPKVEQILDSTTDMPNSLTVEGTASFSLAKGNVALTFNEGPSVYTEQIVDILNQYKVGGTFFFVGNKAAKYSASVQSVFSNRYAIGTMTMNNAQMATLPYEQLEKELLNSLESIEKITKAKVNLFRPQDALFNEDTQDILKKNNVKLILWNKNPHETKNVDSSQLLDTIKNTELSGSIVYLKESKEIVELLPTIIEMAQKQNLKIISLN